MYSSHMFIPTWGNDPQFEEHIFSDGLKLPTRMYVVFLGGGDLLAASYGYQPGQSLGQDWHGPALATWLYHAMLPRNIDL